MNKTAERGEEINGERGSGRESEGGRQRKC